MKNQTINFVMMVSLVLVSLIGYGCSNVDESNFTDLSKHNFDDSNSDFPNDRSRDNMNGTRPEGMPDRMDGQEDMMQSLIDSCDGLSEGDQCTITTPRGEMQSTCVANDDTLICEMQRPDGDMPENGTRPMPDGDMPMPSDGFDENTQ